MAATYVKLASATVGAGGAATIIFSNIPSTYTDLVIKTNLRGDADTNFACISFNGNAATSADLASILLWGNTSASTANTDSNSSQIRPISGQNALSYTANIFGSMELYIPNYNSNTFYKTVSIDGIAENNATANQLGYAMGYWNSTNPITSITLTAGAPSGVFIQNSTATLYGVFNADVSSAPSAPTIGTATAVGNNRASVTFTGVSNAASYTATSTPGSLTGTSTTSPVIVSGLTANTSYTFKVKANNPFGSSAESAASNSITADAGAYDSIATVTSPASYVVEFTNIPQYYKHLQIRVSGNSTRTGYPVDNSFLRFNNDSTNNYSAVRVTGANGGGLSGLHYYTSLADSWIYGDALMANDYANTTGTTIIDIPNYTSQKPKSVWITFGMTADTNGGRITFQSGSWRQYQPINNIRFGSGNIISFAAGTKVALYGIAG